MNNVLPTRNKKKTRLTVLKKTMMKTKEILMLLVLEQHKIFLPVSSSFYSQGHKDTQKVLSLENSSSLRQPSHISNPQSVSCC